MKIDKWWKIELEDSNIYYILFIQLYLYILDQRNLGMSMRVERSTVDQVKKRFELNKKKFEEKKKDYDIEQRMQELKEEVMYSFEKLILNT